MVKLSEKINILLGLIVVITLYTNITVCRKEAISYYNGGQDSVTPYDKRFGKLKGTLFSGCGIAGYRTSFELTKGSMIKLKKHLPETIIEKLKTLKHQEYISENDFLKALEEQIGEFYMVTYQKQILYAARKIIDSEELFKTQYALAPVLVIRTTTTRELMDLIEFSEYKQFCKGNQVVFLVKTNEGVIINTVGMK